MLRQAESVRLDEPDLLIHMERLLSPDASSRAARQFKYLQHDASSVFFFNFNIYLNIYVV